MCFSSLQRLRFQIVWHVGWKKSTWVWQHKKKVVCRLTILTVRTSAQWTSNNYPKILYHVQLHHETLNSLISCENTILVSFQLECHNRHKSSKLAVHRQCVSWRPVTTYSTMNFFARTLKFYHIRLRRPFPLSIKFSHFSIKIIRSYCLHPNSLRIYSHANIERICTVR